MNKEEEQNQVALVGWFRVQYPRLRELISLPSFGENLGPRRMKRLKQMGLTPGWPDIFIAVPKQTKSGDSYGLFIEMKSKKGRLHGRQGEIHEQLRNNGYRVEVCHNWQDAKDIVKEYLSGGIKS